MNNGWTGGQYSIFRVVAGIGLAVSFLHIADLEMPPQATATNWMVPALTWVAAGCAVLVAVGWGDRLAALAISYVSAFLLGHAGMFAYADLLPVLWVLTTQVLLPPAPYGSLAARGRLDPGNSWHMPNSIYGGSWALLVALHVWIWMPLLEYWSALWLVALPLAFRSSLRPWLWDLFVLATGVSMILLDPTGFRLGSVMLLLLTFDPAWIPPIPMAERGGSGSEPYFYDGGCGLCHRWVRFVLAEDQAGSAFRFAPLDSDAFRNAVTEEVRADLPDSVIVKSADGRLLTRSQAVLHIMGRLGGIWRLLAALGVLVPASLLDMMYDGVARIRYRLFAKPADLCPILPPRLRGRFDI